MRRHSSIPEERVSKPLRYNVRRLRCDDSGSLLRLLKQPECQVGFGSEPFETEEDIASWISQCGHDGLHLVATHEAKVVGFGGLFPGRGSRAHVGSVALFVHRKFYRQGIGSMLMATLVGAAEILTLHDRLELYVFRDNAAAIGLYAKFGFATEGVHTGFALRLGEKVDALSMARVFDTSGRYTVCVEDVIRTLNETGMIIPSMQNGLGPH